jgi:DNA-binding NarL/FixJ family response regulator
MNTEAITIGIVEAHIIVRQAMTDWINKFENCTVIFGAGNGMELQQALKTRQAPDILLLDIRMPVMNGFKTMDWLQVHYPDQKVIMFSDRDCELTINRLMDAGARAYIKKGSLNEDELKRAIYDVRQRGYFINDVVNRRVLDLYGSAAKNNRSRLPQLTENEWRFLELISTDLTYIQIAFKIGITPACVDKIRAKMFDLLDVKTRVSLSMFAIRNGIEEIAA